MKLLYFAWIRERIGIAEEEISPPVSVRTVTDLLDWLKQRGRGYEQALADLSIVRVAVNQDYAKLDHPVAPDDEVALFPPVTGG
ncbi:MAG: molybdopterin converting factor subunit 1 [Rhodospirillales bacterium]